MPAIMEPTLQQQHRLMQQQNACEINKVSPMEHSLTWRDDQTETHCFLQKRSIPYEVYSMKVFKRVNSFNKVRIALKLYTPKIMRST